MAATPPSTTDLRSRAVELCSRAAELRLLAARLRARSVEPHIRTDLDACLGELIARCTDLENCSYDLHVCAVEVHRRIPRPREEKNEAKGNSRQMTPTQADAARRILSNPDSVIRPLGHGRWGIKRPWRKGVWSTGVVTVRSMEAHGWLERCGERAESWRDPRRLTEAGKAALVAADAARKAARKRAGEVPDMPSMSRGGGPSQP